MSRPDIPTGDSGYKLTPELAEHAALIWATRFIDTRAVEERP